MAPGDSIDPLTARGAELQVQLVAVVLELARLEHRVRVLEHQRLTVIRQLAAWRPDFPDR